MSLKGRKVFSLMLVFMLIVGIFITPGYNSYAEESKITDITVVHTNDTHGRVEPGDNDGMGFARIATKVKELREQNQNLILLDAGDTLHGLPIATLSEGESIIKLMNEMGYDTMALGNHDFNYGYDRIEELSKIANFSMLGANIEKKDGSPKPLKDYIIKEVNGIKIGIFGLSTPETKYKANPVYTEEINILDPVEVGKEIVKELKEQNVNMIIAVTHLGIDKSSVDTSEKLAKEVDGIDLIVDGHSHSELKEGLQVNNTLIVQTGEYDKNLGIVNLEFTDGKLTKKEATLFPKEEGMKLEPDKQVQAIIDEINEENEPILKEVIGKTTVLLDGERETNRTQETNLGNLMTDAMLDVSGADVALTNGGGIRATINIGDITRGDTVKTFPFGNYLVVKEVQGKDIVAALENGVSAYPETLGGFPQVAGMTFKFDPSKEIGHRVWEVNINGKPIDPDKTYTLATNDFMAAGGDQYVMFKDKKNVGEFEALNEILVNYIKKSGEISPEVEGRIVAEKEPAIEEAPTERPILKVEAYTVKPGDVLWRIAKSFGKTWQELAEYNKLKNPHLIFPGQKILIPVN